MSLEKQKQTVVTKQSWNFDEVDLDEYFTDFNTDSVSGKNIEDYLTYSTGKLMKHKMNMVQSKLRELETK